VVCKRIFVLFTCAFLFMGLLGCSGFRDRRTIWKSKQALARRDKDIGELVEIRGKLKRIIEMKIRAVKLLESANRVLGRKYIEIGSYNLALEALKEAEYLDPNSAFVKKDLGECYYFLGRSAIVQEEREKSFSLSRKYYEASISIQPDLVSSRYGLGLLLFFGYGDVNGAIEQMKQILLYEPENVEAHFALGRFYYEMDELGKALGEYITLNRILPKGSPKKNQVEENILRINRELGVYE
jgi:tetratricopeptide (TPR) repeat protein